MTTRRLNWRSHLLRWAEAQEGKPFAWGSTDCASLVRTALQEMFGRDVVRLPLWTTAREALEVLQEHGPVGRILEGLGATKTTQGFLRAGDIVLAEEPQEVGRVALFICIDGRQCLTTHSSGVYMIELPHSLQCSVYSLWEINANG